MSLDTAYRLSFYLALALACLCLAFAELFFLPWIGFFLVLVVGLLVIAFRVEGRWTLTASEANRLGLGIVGATAVWLIYQIPDENDPLVAAIPWPAGLLPLIGPVLMVLLLVKLFRPKQTPDLWALQIIGLMMVTLACVLAAEPLFLVLCLLYLGAGLWWLSLYHLFESELKSIGPNPETNQANLGPASSLLAPRANCRLLSRRDLGLGLTLRGTVALTVLGLALFLFLPRFSNWQWNPGKLTTTLAGMRTGLEGGIDLNRIGTVEVSDEVAFAARAEQNGQPKQDLPLDQRWRGPTLDFYDLGRWQSFPPVHVSFTPGDDRFDAPRDPAAQPYSRFLVNRNWLPDLGPDQFFLDIKINLKRAGTFVLAERVILGQEDGVHPYQPLGDRPLKLGLFYETHGSGTLLPMTQLRRGDYQYRQVVLPLQGKSLLPTGKLSTIYIRYLENQPVPDGIRERAHEILLACPGMSTAGLTFDDRKRLDPAHRAVVAHALCNYLAASGEYVYSLNLTRKDANLDPTVDFLVNLKQGHCERFAAGLTLLCRSLGIPARVVKGYRGAEHQGDGNYVVRQGMAHSWVEVLLSPEGNEDDWHWLVLEPTPSTVADKEGLGSWINTLEQTLRKGRYMWKAFVLEYDGERQSGTLQSFASQLSGQGILAKIGIILALGVGGLGVLALTAGVLHRLWFRWQARSVGIGRCPILFYNRLLAILARRCRLVPQPAQTPQEFGGFASDILRTRGLSESLVELPSRTARLLYRVRFGALPLSSEEIKDLNWQLRQLEGALKTSQVSGSLVPTPPG